MHNDLDGEYDKNKFSEDDYNDFDGEYKKAEQRIRNRHRNWRELSESTIFKIEDNTHKDMSGAIKQEGRIDFSETRRGQFKEEFESRWQGKLEQGVHLIVIIVSVGGFSSVPLYLFKQTDNPFWTVAAILGGLIGYIIHFSASKLFVAIRLKENYEKAKKSVEPSDIVHQGKRTLLQKVYENEQFELLKEAEENNASISKNTIYVPALLSLIEPIGVFFITYQNKVDPLVSIFVAIFPLLLIWGLAYLCADKIEVHKEYRKLIKYYNSALLTNYQLNYPSNQSKSSKDMDNLTNIELIPHEIDYKEQKMQYYIEALSSNQRKHINIIQAEAERDFFDTRKEELLNIKDKRLIPLPEDRRDDVERKHTSQERIHPDAYSIEERNDNIDKNYKIRGEIIRQRIDNLLGLCNERIKKAEKKIDAHNREDRKIVGQNIKEIEQLDINIEEEE